MPSQVLTTRRVKRRQQRLRLVSKNAKRKVRSVRKHRKTAKKVMRGGDKRSKSIFLETNTEAPDIKLNISKNIFGNTHTLVIEIDLDVYPYDVKSLLIELFNSVKPITLEIKPTIIDKISKQVTPNYRSFLIGLADIPERKGCLPTAKFLIKEALTTFNPPYVDEGIFQKNKIKITHSDDTKEYERQNGSAIVEATTNIERDLLDTNKKCTVTMTLSEKNGMLVCKVTKYTCIGINSYSYHYLWRTRKESSTSRSGWGEEKKYSEPATLYTPKVTDRSAGGNIDYMFSEDSKEYKEQMEKQFNEMSVRPEHTFELIDHAVDAKEGEIRVDENANKAEQDAKEAATLDEKKREWEAAKKDVIDKSKLYKEANDTYNGIYNDMSKKNAADEEVERTFELFQKAKDYVVVAKDAYDSADRARNTTMNKNTWKPYVTKKLNNDNNTFNMNGITISEFIASMFENDKKISVVQNTENQNMPKIEIIDTSKQAASSGDVPVDIVNGPTSSVEELSSMTSVEQSPPSPLPDKPIIH